MKGKEFNKVAVVIGFIATLSSAINNKGLEMVVLAGLTVINLMIVLENDKY